MGDKGTAFSIRPAVGRSLLTFRLFVGDVGQLNVGRKFE